MKIVIREGSSRPIRPSYSPRTDEEDNVFGRRFRNLKRSIDLLWRVNSAVYLTRWYISRCTFNSIHTRPPPPPPQGTSKIKFKALLRHFVTARHNPIDQYPEQMQYFLPPYRYITGDELSALIKSNAEPHKDYVVVDVRDDDYIGGNIKGAVNCPSFSFEDDVDKLVEKTKDVKTVVFHCALSQQRGPKAARIYAEARLNTLKEDEAPKHEVLVLRGGFTEFQLKYKNDAELVENWDKNHS